MKRHPFDMLVLIATRLMSGCASKFTLTSEERAVIGKYNPERGGIVFSGTTIELESDRSFVAQRFRDYGPPFGKIYKGHWILRADTLILNSEPAPKHRNLVMIEQVEPNQSNFLVRVMNLDSSRVLFEGSTSIDQAASQYRNVEWTSIAPLRPEAPNYDTKVSILFSEKFPISLKFRTAEGEYELPISVRTANRFIIFVQYISELPEYLIDLRFLVRQDGSLSEQLWNGRISRSVLRRD